MESVWDLTLSLPNAVYSITLAGTAFVYEATFSILVYVLNSFGHIFDAAFGMFSIVLSFISGTFIMILSCFNFVFSAIISIFNGILTIISSLKYASLYFGSYFLQLFLTLDTKRVVLLLFLVVMVWQLWKMRQRRLAFEAEWKRSLRHRSSDRNAWYLSLSGTSWKSGNFEGKQPNFSHIPSWESGDFNRILDFALRELCHRCRGNISAGPLHFTDKVPLPQTNFTFKADDCVLKHLDTTHRMGCATTREESGGVLVLDATIALRKLTVSIPNYLAQVGLWLFPSICVSGDFVGTVESLTLRTEVALTTPFAAELRSLSITNMGPPHVHITGLGVWTLLWKLLKSSLLSPNRLENFIIPIFERVLQDLTSYVSAIPTPRQEVKRLHWDEMTLTRQIEVQTKVREDITIQTIKYGTRQNEIRPRESTSFISRYQSESSPWDSASTIPQYQSESSTWDSSSTRSGYRTEDFPWEETTIRRTRGYESSPWDTSSTRSGYRTEGFPWEETTIRRTRGYESSPWDTASTRPGYRSEVFPREETTIRRIREYESNHRDTRQMRLAMAPAPRPSTEAVALGVTAGVVAIGAICGITAAVMSSRSRSSR